MSSCETRRPSLMLQTLYCAPSCQLANAQTVSFVEWCAVRATSFVDCVMNRDPAIARAVPRAVVDHDLEPPPSQAHDSITSHRQSHPRVDSVKCPRMATHSRNASQSRRANDSDNDSILGAVLDVPTPNTRIAYFPQQPTNSLTRHASSRLSVER